MSLMTAGKSIGPSNEPFGSPQVIGNFSMGDPPQPKH